MNSPFFLRLSLQYEQEGNIDFNYSNGLGNDQPYTGANQFHRKSNGNQTGTV